MNSTINLVPVDCIEERMRRARCRPWIGALLLVGVLLVVGVGQLAFASSRVGSLQRRLQDLEGQLAESQRKRTVLLAEHGELFQQAKVLVAPLNSSAVPDALAELARRAPEGLVLTRFELSEAAPVERSEDGEPAPTPTRSVAIDGYASETSVVHEFTRVVSEHKVWSGAELLSLQRDTRDGRVVQSFSLHCDWRGQQ